jgi:hypothetical protein
MYTKFTIVGGVNLCYAIIVATCKRYYTKGTKNDIYNHRKHIILFYFLYFFYIILLLKKIELPKKLKMKKMILFSIFFNIS